MRLRILYAARRAVGPLAVALAFTAGCASLGGPALSLQEERRLGEEARAEVERSFAISRDPVAVNHIRDVGGRLCGVKRGSSGPPPDNLPRRHRSAGQSPASLQKNARSVRAVSPS